MRTKKYVFPLTKTNEKLALELFYNGMKGGDDLTAGFPNTVRNKCVLWLTSLLIGFNDPYDFANQAIDYWEDVAASIEFNHS